ncbi:MAG: DUF1624 domain-containing protein [Bacilli bacterium]|nr:DUF1624 domain-containing protein [Bacilli bacterium]
MPASAGTRKLKLPSRSPTKERIFELDFIRGALMLLLVLYHLAYTLGSVSQFFRYLGDGPEPAWVVNGSAFWHSFWYSQPLLVFQLLFSSSFFFLCGVSCGFSRHNARRGYWLLFIAMLETIFLSALNHYLGIDVNVYIGLLHALGIAILFYALVDRFFKSLWVDFSLGVLFLVLFALFYNFHVRYDLTGTVIQPNPYFYKTPSEAVAHLGELFLGYATAGSDSWSPIRLSAFVFLGASASKALYKRKDSLWKPSWRNCVSPITFLGRHSLVVYLAEQIIVLAIMWCVLAPFGYTF